jgi:putative endonuclease
MGAYLYILRCSDGSYYVGTTRGSLDTRIAQHQAGTFDGYTARRRPVTPAFQQHFARIEDAVSAERQVKGWRREKKEALLRGDLSALPELSRRGARRRVLRDGVLRTPPQHEVDDATPTTPRHEVKP